MTATTTATTTEAGPAIAEAPCRCGEPTASVEPMYFPGDTVLLVGALGDVGLTVRHRGRDLWLSGIVRGHILSGLEQGDSGLPVFTVVVQEGPARDAVVQVRPQWLRRV